MDEEEIQKKLLQIEKAPDKNIISNLYEERLNDVISVRQYVLMVTKYDEIFVSLEQQKNFNLELERMKSNHYQDEMKGCKAFIERFMRFELFSNELMYQLIEKIEIDKDKNIEVSLKIDIGEYIEFNAEKHDISNLKYKYYN